MDHPVFVFCRLYLYITPQPDLHSDMSRGSPSRIKQTRRGLRDSLRRHAFDNFFVSLHIEYGAIGYSLFFIPYLHRCLSLQRFFFLLSRALLFPAPGLSPSWSSPFWILNTRELALAFVLSFPVIERRSLHRPGACQNPWKRAVFRFCCIRKQRSGSMAGAWLDMA